MPYVFERAEDKKVLVLISNDLACSAEEIAELYKQRWQIELFFKWIKQHLKIKKILGRSANAVIIQVRVTMIAYVLLTLIQLGIQSHFSLQKIARILSLSLMARRAIEGILHPDPGRNENNDAPSPQLEWEVSYV